MTTITQEWTIGMDLGDKSNQICVLNREGEITTECSVGNTEVQLSKFFKDHLSALIIIEAGTHSSWIERLLKNLQHEVIVANPRKVSAIWMNKLKTDKRDAQMLARMGRFDIDLLCPVKHRGLKSQVALCSIRARDIMVRARQKLILHVRSSVKGFGYRISKCSTESFHKKSIEDIPDFMYPVLRPLIRSIALMSQEIKEYDKQIDQLCDEHFPETKKIGAIAGVGSLTALAFVLTIDDPKRFRKSRDIAPYLGLVPGRDQSGSSDKPMPITKSGNCYIRRLLVGSANYIMGPFGPDCDLRRFGEKLGSSPTAKKKAKVAVARKLAVLMHRLWVHDETYDPFFNHLKKAEKKSA
ncbi:MAG: IS110 family transposase [Lentisphaeria bacterium]|nr:IS110 family transposase [Lentisphaeria bacterium]NQZ70189.1 IS110 family transposase [Lentisphaeria bacterium]